MPLVNVASLLETNGAPGRVNISESTHHRVHELFATQPRGSVDAKNKGQLAMVFVDRIKPEFAADSDGRIPNEQFRLRRSGVGLAAAQWPSARSLTPRLHVPPRPVTVGAVASPRSLADARFAPGLRPARSLDRNALREIPRLVHIRPAQHCRVISK